MAVRKVQPGWWFWYEGLGSVEVWCADTYEEALNYQPKKPGPWRGNKRVMHVYIQPHRTSEGLERVFTRDRMEVAPGPEQLSEFQERVAAAAAAREAEKDAKKREREG